jgi:nitrite reductase/ring-hydroxylating ferredoxin subunit
MSWLTDRLASLLAEREMTAEHLARQLAVEKSRLGAIIAGIAVPNDNLTRRLARAFGEDPESWVANAGRAADAKPAADVAPGFVKVATVSEMADGDMKIVCDGRIVVANSAGRFHAFGNICPHAEGQLGEGFLDGCVVECPWHSGQWDITTGKGLTAFATADIPLFEVRIVGDDIEVKPTLAGSEECR